MPPVKINPRAPEPANEQLAAIIRERIRDGTYPPRSAIPSITEIVAETGLAIGTAGAVFLTRVLKSQLYAVRPGDPETLLAVAAILTAAAMAASYAPARRATHVDPMLALREE